MNEITPQFKQESSGMVLALCTRILLTNKPKRILLLFLALFIFSTWSGQRILAQCNPTITLAGAITDTTFCVTDSNSYQLLSNVNVPLDTFVGSGVTDVDGTDQMAVFFPFQAGAGTHVLTYTIKTGSGSCVAGELATFMVTVEDSNDAGMSDSLDVCRTGGQSVDLHDYLGGTPALNGTWSMAGGVQPSGYMGTLSASQIAGMAPGDYTFQYKVDHQDSCPADSSSIKVSIIEMPQVNTPLEAISPVCIGDSVVLTITGVDDGTYLVNYKIDTIDEATVLANASNDTLLFHTRPLTLSDNGKDITITTLANADAPACLQVISDVQTLSVIAPPTASIMSTDTTICTGETVTFTGSGGDTYHFLLNGTVVSGTVGNTYTTDTLTNTDEIAVIAENSTGCIDTSETIIIIENNLPVLNLVASDSSICEGDAVTFTAGGATTYTFLLDGQPVAGTSGNTYTTDTLESGNQVRVIGTSASGCSDTSTMITMTVDTIPVAILELSDTTICDGELITFYGSGGDAYEVLLNGNPVTGSGSGIMTGIGVDVLTTSGFADGDEVQLVASNTAGCSDTSAIIVLQVNPFPTATIMSSDTTICAGEEVIFTSSAGDTTHFLLNGSLVFSTSGNTYATDSLQDGDAVNVIVTTNGCSDTSSMITMTVNPVPVADIITTDSICEGQMVTVTGTGGVTYDYLVNGTVALAGASTPFNSSTLNDGDILQVVAINSDGCSDTSDIVRMVVEPAISISTSQSATAVCVGNEVIFSANGAWEYAFLLNNQIVQARSAQDSYTTDSLQVDDLIQVVGYNVGICTDTAAFDPVTLLPLIDAELQEDKDTACIGELITFETNLASAYEFYVNDSLAHSGSSIYQTSDLENGDEVKAVLYNTNGCTDTSNIITITIIDHPVATLSANSGNLIIPGQAVIFTAAGGTSYEFFINDNSVQGPATTDTFATNTLNDQDRVKVIVQNDNGCIGADSLQVFYNSPPVATDDTITVAEDGMIDILVLNNDVDNNPDDSLMLSQVSTPDWGTAILMDSIIRYLPNIDYFGMDTLEYVVCDNSGNPDNCDTATVSITVSPVNDLPVAINDSIVVEAGSPANIVNVLQNDYDVDDVDLTVSIFTAPNKGIATTVSNAEINYVPHPDSSGTDVIVYELCDDEGACTYAILFIEITPMPLPPIVVDDYATVIVNSTNNLIPILENDIDPNGNNKAFWHNILLFYAENGAIPSDTVATLNDAGDTLTYSPPVDFVGVDSFYYIVYDSSFSQQFFQDTGYIYITVIDTNNTAPIANADFVNARSGEVVIIDVQANDLDMDGDELTTTLLQGASNGNSVVTLDADSIQYSAAIDFVGMDTLVYQVCDNRGACDTDSVFITIDNEVKVAARVFLGGPYVSAMAMMHDSLRSQGRIPLTEPYSSINNYVHTGGGETITNPAILNITGSDAIVDWVFLELLDSADTSVVATRAALIKRNGHIVDVDGVSAVTFSQVANGDYFVVIRHRNHLGVMTEQPQTLSATGFDVIDLTNPSSNGTAPYGTHPMKDINGRTVLWSGDGNSDGQVILAGPDNDKDPIFFDVLNDSGNTGSNYNYISRGYQNSDHDMNGASIYDGRGNDQDIIFFNIFTHPGNTSSLTVFIISEQLPVR